MRYLFRNFHIFVFAFFSVFAALLVANGPQQAVNLVRPLVEDAVEVRDMTAAAYGEVRQLSLDIVSAEAVSLYVATLRMPSMLFERLAERLGEAERKMSMPAQDSTVVKSGDLETREVSFGSLAIAASHLRKQRI